MKSAVRSSGFGNAIEVRCSRGVKGISARWVRRVLRVALDDQKAQRRAVSVFLTNNREIRKINRDFLKHDYPTDVISFWCPEKSLGPGESGYLGDLAVSVQMAREVSRKLGLPFKEELARYLVHGVLHLLGYEDKGKRDRMEMDRKQEAILKKVARWRKGHS